MSTTANLYSEAKKALNASAPERVICRTNENEKLEAYFEKVLSKKKPMSIYVNGQPGTGKTLTINHLIDNFKVNNLKLYKILMFFSYF